MLCLWRVARHPLATPLLTHPTGTPPTFARTHMRRLSNTEFYMMETAPAEEQEAAAALGELDGIAITTAAAAAAASSNGNGAHSISGGSGGQGAAVGSTAAAPLARRPTWRIVQGISTESMALDVARRCRLPSRVVERAAELYQQLEPPAKPEEADQGAAAAAVAGQAVAGQAAVEPASPSPSGVPRGRAARATAARSSSPSSSTSSSPWTLEAASKALQQVAQEALANCGPAEVPPAQLQVGRGLGGHLLQDAWDGSQSCLFSVCSPMPNAPTTPPSLPCPRHTAGGAVCAAGSAARPRHRGHLVRLCPAPQRRPLLRWLNRRAA